MRLTPKIFSVLCLGFLYTPSALAESRVMSIFHFDVNKGDATLIVGANGRAVLIDAGDEGRGLNPITEFMNRAKREGFIKSLDYTIASHYDSDHIGGMDEVLLGKWKPRLGALDRGDQFLPPFDRNYVRRSCRGVNVSAAQSVVPWGTAPAASCKPGKKRASCALVRYMLSAKKTGKRATLKPGAVIRLGRGATMQVLVANGVDLKGNTAKIHFSGRRSDCAANDLGVGLLVKAGKFRYLAGGDLTGDRRQKVAEVEELIRDDVGKIDVYHINHHGAETSSELRFMRAISPTVAIASNGGKFGHPRKTVVKDRILKANSKTVVYATNLNSDAKAWKGDKKTIADLEPKGYDGMIEVAVYRRTFKVYMWRNGSRLDQGKSYRIRRR